MTPNWITPTPLKFAWTGLSDPQFMAMLAQHPIDGVVLDMQHGTLDERAVLDCIAALAFAGKPTVVRVPLDRWDMLSRALDFGAAGVIAPMINTPEDARKLAEASKYVPTGSRSYGPRPCAQVWGMDSTDYVRRANDFTLCLAMIETREAIDNLDEILAVPGIDGIYIGPGDLSISLRSDPVPDGYGPDSRDTIAQAAAKTNAAGKLFAAYTSTPDQANWVHSIGGGLISVADDAAYLRDGIKPLLAQLDF